MRWSLLHGPTYHPRMRGWFAVLGALAVLGCSPPVPPNLVFVSIDTLRPDHLSAYGYARPTSPVIDALAARGVRFSQAFAVMPTTLPSHLAMLTGLHPSQLGILRNGQRVPRSAETLAEILRAAGYRTGAFVSATPMHSATGLRQGFEIYDDVPSVRRGWATAERAVAWLDEVRTTGPFFLMLHLYDPHAPYHAPEPFRRKFSAGDRAQPPRSEFLSEREVLDPDSVQAAIDAYDAEVAFADASTGLLLKALDDLDLRDDTLVVLVSDHGESFAELQDSHRYVFDHGEFLYAHQLHVPLVFSMPGQRDARVEPTPVSTVDLMPTILELMGREIPDGLYGRSLARLVLGTAPPGASGSPVLSERRSFDEPAAPVLRGNLRSVVDGSWHFIAGTEQLPELYDLAADPRERENLASSHASRANELQAALEAAAAPLDEAASPAAGELSPEMLERLRALGYAP